MKDTKTSRTPQAPRRAQMQGKPRGSAPADKKGRPDEGERIAKRLARAGVASRRDAEAMIVAGRVQVNGRVLDTPAFKVGEADRIEVDGEPIPEVERTRLFLFHKPAGVVTSSRDPEGRKTVFDILPEGLPRLVTVGRLDINTEGLLLLTNDGGLARILELPSTSWLRRYRVRVHGSVDPLALAELEHGTAVDGVFYGAIEATIDRKQGSNAWLTVGLREGKNREVKNVLGALGLDVTRLIRVSYGPFQLGALPEGAVQEIKGRALRDQLGKRLIEEAGANFEAPIARPFSSKPVRAGQKTPEAPKSAPGGRAKPQGGRVEGRTAPPRGRKERDERRQELRDRLQTKPPSSHKGKGRSPNKREERGEKGSAKPALGGRSRASNVWMAPGARPVAVKKTEKEAGDKGAPGATNPGKRKPTRQTGRPQASSKPRFDRKR